MEESSFPPSNCVRNLISTKSDDSCQYKQIKFKNHFIRTSEEKVYAFIMKPIELVKQCGNTEKIFHLTQSQEIPVKTGCTIFKYYGDEQFTSPKSTNIDIHKPNTQSDIDFTKIQTQVPIPELPILNRDDVQQLKSSIR